MAESLSDPLSLLASEVLFSGAAPDRLPEGAEVISDLDHAMILENEQDLPSGYRIWKDMQTQEVAEVYSRPCYREAMGVLDPMAEQFFEAFEPVRIELRKKEIRRKITRFEEFYTTVIFDVSEQLKAIAGARHCLGSEIGPVLSAMQIAFAAGFYPCGWTADSRIVCFDPRSLEGHQSNPMAGFAVSG